MYNIITVKHGTLYDARYVNNMYSMMERHVTLPFKFYCVTDDHTDIRSEVTVLKFPDNFNYKGWWTKPYIFKIGLFEHDVNFYIDLDMVIVDNIDCFLTHESGNFIGMANFIKKPSLASGIMRWKNNTMNMIYERLNSSIVGRYPGDQEYIWYYHKNHMKLYPNSWVESYKWHYKKNRLVPGRKIIAFHGRPNPHEVDDEMIVSNWR